MASLFGSASGRIVGKAVQKRAKGLPGPGGSEQYTGIKTRGSRQTAKRPKRRGSNVHTLGPVPSPLTNTY